jgi:methylmalonyl-CoA mutase C-terminal domain/subunit
MLIDENNRLRSKKRILIAKIGLDGHDRGAKIIVNFLKESGYQVIYSGLHKTPDQIVDIAIQEDVDAIGISILSGSHTELVSEFFTELNSKSLSKIIVFIGGTIPNYDFDILKRLGVNELFPTGTEISSVLFWLDKTLQISNSQK